MTMWATNCLQCPRFDHAYRACLEHQVRIEKPQIYFCNQHPRFDKPVFDRIESQRYPAGVAHG